MDKLLRYQRRDQPTSFLHSLMAFLLSYFFSQYNGFVSIQLQTLV